MKFTLVLLVVAFVCVSNAVPAPNASDPDFLAWFGLSPDHPIPFGDIVDPEKSADKIKNMQPKEGEEVQGYSINKSTSEEYVNGKLVKHTDDERAVTNNNGTVSDKSTHHE